MIEANIFPSEGCGSRVCPARKGSLIRRGLGPLIKRGNVKYHLSCLPDRALTKGDTIK
jgi:hypothetical protein